jgi:hypothetical protein
MTDTSSEGRSAAMFCAVAPGLYGDIDEAIHAPGTPIQELTPAKIITHSYCEL